MTGRLRLATIAAACALWANVGIDHAEAEPRHGISAFGDLKYPADFKHFDYVDTAAPKGGRLAMIGTAGRTTFDSFNDFILKGDSAQGLEYLFDTLMTRAMDEPDAVYGLVAKTADVASDGRSVVFALRPDAKFADGTPVTAGDVVFSFDTLKAKGHPRFSISLRDVEKAEAVDPLTVRYTFSAELTRDLPLLVAELPILSKAFYTAHPFDESSLTKPLGSGPYEIADYKSGTFVSYKRRADYWAKDLPVASGRFNFDELRCEYYRERTIELENLKSGVFDWREEFTSIDWATAYDIPAVKAGRLVKTTLPDERPSGAQGFFVNLRRDKFKDIRVREALGLAFDFEWSNKNLFFGIYKRTASFFENSDLKANGPPSPDELALLEPYRDKLPASVFGEPVTAPVNDGSGNIRENLKRARDLLATAGWTVRQEAAEDPSCGFFCRMMRAIGLSRAPLITVARNAAGEPLAIEFLIDSPGFERVIGPYIRNLQSIGVQGTIRRVDPSQYERRTKSFDFDMVIQRYALRLTPGVELKNFWGSSTANMDGSFNLAGIADPVIDVLIDKVLAAKSRPELETATRAIDRVLRAGYYWVPHYYKAEHNIAFWNKYSWPSTKPKYDPGVIDTWWYDSAKAAALGPQR